MLIICLIIPTSKFNTVYIICYYIVLYIADPLYQMLYIIFWGLLIILCFVYVYKNGTLFVDSPKLVQTQDKKIS